MSGSASLLKTVLKLTVLVILPVLIVSAMVWYIVLSDIGQAREELKKVVPNFTMTGGSSVVFAADGKKLYDLKSDYAEYFSVTDSTSFVNPSADFYNEKTGIKSFFLRGDAGVYNTGDMLTLTDNVLGLRYDEQGKLSGRLRSDYLEYDFDDRHVRSNVRVVYTDIYPFTRTRTTAPASTATSDREFTIFSGTAMQSSIQKLRVSLLLAMGLLSAGTAAALQSDSDQPINIPSATQEADLNNNIAIFTGDVVIIQGSIEIHADRVEVYKAVPEKKQTTHIIAYGKPATFHQILDDGKPVDALGKKLAYDVDQKLINITGDGQVKQLNSQINAENLTYGLEKGQLTANCKGGSGCGKTQRVTAVIDPKEMNSEKKGK